MFDGYCIFIFHFTKSFFRPNVAARQWTPREIQLRLEFVFVFVFIRLFIALGKVKSIFYSVSKLVTFRSLEAATQPFKLVYMNTCTNLHVMQPINLNFYEFFLSLNCSQSGLLLARLRFCTRRLVFAQLNRTIADLDWIPVAVAANTQKRI